MLRKLLLIAPVAAAGVLLAQQYMFPPEPGAFGSYGVDWTTVRGDAQRSSWIRNDRLVNTKSVAATKPAFGLLFKLKMEGNLSEAVLVGQARGGRGFKSMGYVGSTSGGVFGFDYDTGQQFWKEDLGTPACAGLSTAITRPTPLTFAEPTGGGVMAATGGLAQLPSQFNEGSAVGEPDAGAVNIPFAGTYSFTGGARGGSGGPARGGGGGGGGRGGGANGVYGLALDGKVHLMSFQQGFDVQMQPVQLVPPNARTAGFIVVNNTAYAATMKGCGAAEDGIWAVSLAASGATPRNWKSNEPIAGTAGFAFTTTGNIVVATQHTVVILDSATMQPKDTFTSTAALNTSPVVFTINNRELIAVGGADGRIVLLDSASPKQALAYSPNTGISAGAIAAFTDTTGTHWILAPGPTGITAIKATEQSLTTGWTSRPMVNALTPVVMNGVAFALSGGSRTTPAVLYALDGTTGKELWNSGKAITSFASPSSGLAASVGQIYLSTNDNELYTFSLLSERQ